MKGEPMRYVLCSVLVLVAGLFWAQPTPAAEADAAKKGVLVRSIEMEGFILGDKGQFTKIFKMYRNKYLTPEDTDGILAKIQKIYEREGYLKLVSITYVLKKHRLIYSVAMNS